MRSPAESQALARTGPAALARLVDPGFEATDHLWLIDEALVEAVWAARERQRDRPKILLISTPPRHGKSTLVSEYAPAWYLGSFPDERVILASYEADFAASWGMRARNVLTEHGEALFGVAVSSVSKAARHRSTSSEVYPQQERGRAG